MTDPKTDNDSADLPVRIFATLKSELMKAGADSTRIINALEKFGESINQDIIPGIKKGNFLSFESERLILEFEIEKQRRDICWNILSQIEGSIHSLDYHLSDAERKYSEKLRELESQQ